MKEQIADIKCDIKDVKTDIKSISDKLDSFADKKADKSDVSKMWYWILGIVASMLVGLFFYVINKI